MKKENSGAYLNPANGECLALCGKGPWPDVARPSSRAALGHAYLHPFPAMEPWHFLSSLVFALYLSLTARAAALTISLAPNERSCFFADVDKAGEKIGVRSTRDSPE